MLRTYIKKFLRKLGYDIHAKHPTIVDYLNKYKIEKVLDVGANKGQYGLELRDWGYAGKIISLEPLSHAYNALQKSSQADPLWDSYNFALGSFSGETEINVSELSVFSSILPGLPALKNLDSRSNFEKKETIKIFKLDDIFSTHCDSKENIYLKVDTQGFEKEVILGGVSSLENILGVQLELSLRPLYEGEAMLAEMIGIMEKEGFSLVQVLPVTYDHKTLFLQQLDCIFLKL